jgi:hypothetical protein
MNPVTGPNPAQRVGVEDISGRDFAEHTGTRSCSKISASTFAAMKIRKALEQQSSGLCPMAEGRIGKRE